MAECFSEMEIDLNEILIPLVEEKKILYDKSSCNFKDNIKKKDAWDEIASSVFQLLEKPVEVKYLITRWTTLKKRYMEERKKVREYIPSGSGADPELNSDWKYYAIMNFLEHYVQHRRTVSNFKLPGRDEDETDDCSDEEDDEFLDQEHSQDSEEEETSHNEIDQSGSSPTTPATTSYPEVSNYLLVFRDAWKKIPEKNKKKLFSSSQEGDTKRTTLSKSAARVRAQTGAIS